MARILGYVRGQYGQKAPFHRPLVIHALIRISVNVRIADSVMIFALFANY